MTLHYTQVNLNFCPMAYLNATSLRVTTHKHHYVPINNFDIRVSGTSERQINEVIGVNLLILHLSQLNIILYVGYTLISEVRKEKIILFWIVYLLRKAFIVSGRPAR